MKTRTVKTSIIGAIAAVAAMASASCVDEFEETFGVNMGGFILQTDSCGVQQFEPHIYFTSTSTTFKLKDVKAFSTDLQLNLKQVNDYTFASTGDQRFAKPTDLNGTYSIISTALTGDVANSTLTFNYAESDTLSMVDVKKLEYKSSYIRITLGEVANAKTVGIVLTPYNNGSKPNRTYDLYQPIISTPTYNNGITETAYYFDLGSMYGTDHVQVRVYVTNGKNIYRESDVVKTLTKGEIYFDEDKPAEE